MRKRLGLATHALSDRLHAVAHGLVGDPDWRQRNGVELEQIKACKARLRAAASALAGGYLTPSEQMALSSHLHGFHGMRKSLCPSDCPLRLDVAERLTPRT